MNHHRPPSPPGNRLLPTADISVRDFSLSGVQVPGDSLKQNLMTRLALMYRCFLRVLLSFSHCTSSHLLVPGLFGGGEEQQ